MATACCSVTKTHCSLGPYIQTSMPLLSVSYQFLVGRENTTNTVSNWSICSKLPKDGRLQTEIQKRRKEIFWKDV